MITPNYFILFKKLDRSKLNDVQIVDTPIATVNIDGDTKETKFGGYKALVHYNRQKEIQHRKDKNNKRIRNLRKKIAASRSHAVGDSFPDVTLLDLGGRTTF